MTTNKQTVTRSFRKEGTKVIMKQTNSDLELDSKDVLDNIQTFESNIKKTRNGIEAAKSKIINDEELINDMTEDLKKIKKFEDWAREVQESKAKILIKEVFNDCKEQVDSNYKPDATLSDKENGIQKYRQLQMAIATHPKIALDINNKLMQKLCFTECIIDNPWAGK